MLERSGNGGREFEFSRRVDRVDPRIAAVISRMEETLHVAHGLEELAAVANLSLSRLSHLFREQTGLSLGRYRHQRRMERARILIERTFLSIKQVMACVGINDPSHFARDFRRHHGVGPSELRARGCTTTVPYTQPDRPTASGNGQQTPPFRLSTPRYRRHRDTEDHNHAVTEPRRKRS